MTTYWMRLKQTVGGLLWCTALAVVLGTVGCQTDSLPVGDARRANEHLEQAHQFLDQGLTDSALAAFGLAIEENPNLVEGHMGMGNIYRERAEYDRAVQSYEIATVLDPDSFDANYYLGLTFQLSDEPEKAISKYLRALVVDPTIYDANSHLGSAFLQLGRPSEALPYIERAVSLRDDSQLARANLATTYSLLGQYEKAVDHYRQAMELGEFQAPILLGFAQTRIKLEQYELAENVLDQLIRRDPGAIAHERLGYCHFKRHRFNQAQASYEAALLIDADHVAALNGLGATLMTKYLQTQQSNPPLFLGAMSAWRHSVALRSGQPRIIDLIARFHRP